jgi:hypothetical protein
MPAFISVLQTIAKIIASVVATSIIEAGRKTHDARVSRYRNHPHGWRPPDEGNQNSQTDRPPEQQTQDSETPEIQEGEIPLAGEK